MVTDAKLKYLNDSWTIDDRLSYDHLRTQLVGLAHETDPPFACAIFGGWGSGKTSLLRTVQNHLGGSLELLSAEDSLVPYKTDVDQLTLDAWESKVPTVNKRLPCVWFNPWQHQFEGHPLIALLHEIRNQFSRSFKALGEGEKLVSISIKNGLRIMDDLIGSATKALFDHKLQLNIDKIEASGVAYEKEHFQSKLDSQRFQMHFEAAIAHLTGSIKLEDQRKKGKPVDQGKRVVIFIDDLDRCESGQVLKLLESIKLYLSTRKCVFFFGLDPEHIESALRKEGLGESHNVRAYLQKMFQLTLHLPKPNTLELIGALYKRLESDVFEIADQDQFTQLLAEILETNPRRVKNFLNQLFLHGRVFQARHSKRPKGEVMALLLTLHNYFPLTYSILEGHPTELPKIIQSLQADRPDVADDGFNVTIIKETFLPQMEAKRAENQKFMALDAEHYANARALFLVLDRFKKRFMEIIGPLKTAELLEYLQP